MRATLPGVRVLITFSGLDGAGKSTLIEWLKDRLEAQRRPVVVFHMNDHIGLYAYLRVLRNCVTGHPPLTKASEIRSERPSEAGQVEHGALRRMRDAVVWNRPLRRWIYLFDLAVFVCYRTTVEKLRGRILIMDRYFYDTLVGCIGRPRLGLGSTPRASHSDANRSRIPRYRTRGIVSAKR